MKQQRQQFFLIILITVCCHTHTFSQQKYKAEYYLTENGLPSNAVLACSMDSIGYLWLATRRGICRFDGYIFQPSVTTAGNCVSMFAGNNGLLSFYNNNTGLQQLNPYTDAGKTLAAVNFTDAEPANDHYNNVFVDNEDRVWCTDFKNIKYLEPGNKNLKQFALSKYNYSTDKLAAFLSPVKNEVLVASINGLFRWNKKFDSLQPCSNLQLRYLSYTAAAVVGSDSIALAAGNTVFIVQPSTFNIISKTQVTTDVVEQIVALAVTQTNNNKSIIAASKGNVFCSNTSFSIYNPVFSTDNTGGSINTVFAASNKNIWVCTNHGLIKLMPGNDAINNYKIPNNKLKENYVTCIIKQNKPGYYFIGTSGGNFLSTNLVKWANITLPDASGVNSIAWCDSVVLIATTKGLFIYNQNNIQRIPLPQPYNSAAIKKILITENYVWLLPAGLPVLVLDKLTLQPSVKMSVKNTALFSANNVWNDIEADAKGNIFLAGWIPEGYGLAKLDIAKNEFIAVSKKTSNEKLFIGDYYNRIAKSTQFHLLFSGYGGFNTINEDGAVTKIISINDHPLTNEHAEGIAAMPDSIIWFGTEEGIQIWNPANDHISLITTLNGLPYNNALFAFEPIDTSILAVGFNKTVSFVNTNLVFNSNLINKLVISKILLNGTQKYFSNNQIEVQPTERNITLFFSALNFSDNKAIQYWYRINGGGWMSLGVNPSLVFSNFKNGTYLLEIKVTDNFTNQQNKTLQLTINALPFFYETIWFKILLPLIVTLVLLSVFLYRLHQINKWNKFRTALSQDLHDDAGATLSSVNILSTMLTEQEPLSPKAKLYMQRITDDVKLLQLKLDEIIWSLKKNTGNMQQVYNRLVEYGGFIMEAKQMVFTAEASPDLDHIALPIKKLRNIYLVAKEALNNIAKHSNAKNALLNIVIQEKNICIIIKDDGKGNAVDNMTDRNGITGMHRRIKEIKGKIQVSSAPGQGTAITITLKY